MNKKALWSVVLAAVALALLSGVLFACSQTPTSVPVRTFERAQRMDVVCLRVLDPATGLNVRPEPRRQEECIPVPPNLNGGYLENQLFALVTQSTRGEIAVVNLSGGFLIDQRRDVPGVNFIPVGKLPTDIAVTPDGQMAFVGASEPNKAAIYGVPTRRLLGDGGDRPNDPEGQPTLASWPVCALPQNPGALTVVPRRKEASPLPDAGAAGPDTYDYEIVAVLPGDQRSSAKVVTIDPRPFLRGANIAVAGDADAGAAGPVLAPGSLAPCPITAAIELQGQSAVPATLQTGARWPDAVPYVDGGVNLACDKPDESACAKPACCTADGGAPDASACTDTAVTTGPKLDLGVLEQPRLVAAARDDQTLYVADANLPLVHVIDLSTPLAPKELAPFVATSAANPSRAVSIRDVAVSPPTHDYKRYLYAVDRDEGSILVYDISDPQNASREPMRRPHAELNPFAPEDRIAFSSPVVAVSFARHDYPLHQINGQPLPSSKTGVLCNPNPNITADNAQATGQYGFYYRASSSDPDFGLDPRRLRGIFAFATLANGNVVAIDVDDWDAPCRRPAFLGSGSPPSNRTDITKPPFNALAIPQPDPGANDFDPYHAPVAPQSSVSDELFFPVSAPHRMRSDTLLSTANSLHVPRVEGTPTVTASGTPLAFTGPDAEKTPLLLPTGVALPQKQPDGTLNLVGAVGVTFSYESPEVHVDQDWTLTYEGKIPGFEGISAVIRTEQEQAGGGIGNYDSLVLSQPEGRFCARGVEDWSRGIDRAQRIASELPAAAAPAGLDRQIADYVQLTEDLLDPSDPYWSAQAPANDPGASCWGTTPPGDARYNVCSAIYGAAIDQSPERDFPILEAYQDRLVIGRFVKADDGSRRVVYRDPTNDPYLKLMRCCFHHQVKFTVRTGGVWSLVGNAPGGGPGVGFLSHMVPDAGNRCVASCDAREALLNSRAPALPGGVSIEPPARNSALALRNPMFSFWMLNGYSSPKLPLRDAAYSLHTRGRFSPLSIAIGGNTTISVNPQSMKFIESLGQIAVVDAASQGLVLIDLGGVAIARSPYY